MKTTLTALLMFIAIWPLLGCVVLAAVDKDGELLEWYRSAPGTPLQKFILQGGFWLAWPLVVFEYTRDHGLAVGMLTDTTVNAMLDAITLDLASLHTAYSATGANEVTGGSPAYAKKAITMAAAASRARAASTQPVFDVPAATTVRFIGLWTNAGTVFRGMFANGGSEKGFQVDVTNNKVLCENHGLINDDKVVFYGGTPPTGLTEGTVYFVVGNTAADPDTFQVALTIGGAAIDITGQHTSACKFSKIIEEAFGAQGTFTVSSLSEGITE